MSEFFKSSLIWVVDFRHDGRPRRWFKVLDPAADVHGQMTTLLHERYGARARRVEGRPATPDEETQYLHGEEPRNAFCPTGRTQGPRPEP
jgi:hypothetical protein